MTDERRRAIRISRQETVKVELVIEDSNIPPLVFECNSRDFSRQGIRLHGRQPLEKDIDVNLMVHLQEEQKDLNLVGTIKWVTETTEKEYLAGLQLSESSDTDIGEWHLLFSE
ncbi:PilZ domain-containing protein [Aliikangiella coralliicola]|uniref:PilZ domain-containing protein n=1 Tax=Aliikangiella coralliicola TaxID=2592383 RepID=A0A545UBL3_9GAMM|nr:PilZ domain-containing protein [Aliikangiella coralliicola]TQV86855.1 PilZ domain-containing protein [Aliikangiella coralliicola]